MRKALHIILFSVILGFLLYQIPQVNRFFKTQLFYAETTVDTYVGTPMITTGGTTTPLLPSSFNYNPLGNVGSTLYATETGYSYSAPTSGTYIETVPTPAGFPSGFTYIASGNGQIAYLESFDIAQAHEPYCSYAHLHAPAGTTVIFDIYGEQIGPDPDPGGCGYGIYMDGATTPSSPTSYPLPVLYPEPVDYQPTISYAPPAEPVPTDTSTIGTTTTSTTGGIMIGTTSTTDTTGTTVIDGGPSTFIEDGTTGSGTTGSGTTGAGTTGSGTTGSTTTGTSGTMPVECIDTGNKDFDYGAVASANPQWNIPWGTEEAPHFVSHSQFYSVRIGPSVDAPEYVAADYESTDQDGLELAKSTNARVVLNDIYNVRNRYGTIVVGRWEKLEGFYDFRVLAAVQVSKSSFIFQPDGVYVNFETVATDMHEGWLTVLYFDAEGEVTEGVPGSNQFAINGMPNFGFTLDQVKQWNGTNPDLDRIIYGAAREAFDVSRAPGEVEDYLYCDRGPNGFRYYLPNDPQYAADCGVEELPPPPIDVCFNTPTTGTPSVNVVCNFNNVQSFVCPTVPGTGGVGTTGTTTTTAPIDNRPVAAIIEDLLTQYRNTAQPNAETRLRIIHQYLRAVLPQL